MVGVGEDCYAGDWEPSSMAACSRFGWRDWGKQRHVPASCQDILHDLAALQSREPYATAAADNREVFVIKAEQMQDRGMEVAEMHCAISDDTAVVIRLAVRMTGFHAAAG